MSAPAANCPSCGAPVVFRWSSAVQTTCPYCHSILIRAGLDLQHVGVVADLPPDSSPLQIGSEGVYQNHSFVVIGRILYEYDQGGWNEWHIVYNDGASGWLSDAQLEYDLSRIDPTGAGFPDWKVLAPGGEFKWQNKHYVITSITRAHYKGVEGELPFEYWDKKDAVFVDLRTHDGEFGTLDYSSHPPLLFLGLAVEFDDLHLKNLRTFEGWP